MIAVIEVRQTRLAAESINKRMADLTASILLETREGLEADWTAIAEGFEAVRDAASTAAAAAWRIAYEGDTSPERERYEISPNGVSHLLVNGHCMTCGAAGRHAEWPESEGLVAS